MPGSRARGYTLIELLTVIAIIAVLLSISVGVIGRLGKRNELEATASAVRNVVRRARNAAREERAPAVVELDVAAGEVRAATRETLVLHRFEGSQLIGAPDPEGAVTLDDPKAKKPGKDVPPEYEVAGSFNIQGHVYGADPQPGRLGDGLEFRRPGSHVAIPDRPSLSPIEGIAIEVWIRPAALEPLVPKKPEDREGRDRGLKERVARAGKPPTETPPRALQWWSKHPDDPPLFSVVRKGRAFEVAVTAAYALQVAITGPLGAGEVTHVTRTADLTVRPEKWQRIQVAFDGRDVSCAIDGIRHALYPVGGPELPERLIRDRSPLLFSDPDPERAFAGLLDEVKLQAVIRSERLQIPKNISLLAPLPLIHFEPLGGLDPLRHAEPVVFWLTDAEEGLAELAALQTPPPGVKTKEKKPPADPTARGVDPEKLRKWGALAAKLGEARAKTVTVELTGAVGGGAR